ncbi:MAG: hypothetical protein RL264_1115 [Bacteroidota bacterium]
MLILLEIGGKTQKSISIIQIQSQSLLKFTFQKKGQDSDFLFYLSSKDKTFPDKKVFNCQINDFEKYCNHRFE